jgi:hypothetical protein
MLSGAISQDRFRRLMRETIGPIGIDVEVLGTRRLSGRVHRVEFTTASGGLSSVILKDSRASRVERNRLVLTEWLPAVGLRDAGPRLLAAEKPVDVASVWAIYEDCGDNVLSDQSGAKLIESALDLVGQIHAAFAKHPLRADIEVLGKSPGSFFFDTPEMFAGVIVSLEDLASDGSSPVCRIVSTLSPRLQALSRAFVSPPPFVEPHSLIHGDLFPSNVIFEVPEKGSDSPVTRLIDWDRAGLGPVTFDVAFLLSKLNPENQRVALSAYRGRMEPHFDGWPTWHAWDSRFRTIRFGRILRSVSTYAALVRDGQEEYGVEKLTQVEGWLSGSDWSGAPTP